MCHLGHHGEGVLEEHVLPDNFDDYKHPGSGSGVEPKSSVSPASRKSASSHTSKGSEDSGISIPVKTITTTINTNNNVSLVHHNTMDQPKFKLGEIEANNIIAKKSKKIREFGTSKAWYDVPSDDDTEAPEADSLASIISHRGSSDEEHL